MPARRKTRIKHLFEKKQRGERIVGMECHETPSAIMAEELGADIVHCGSPGPMGLFGHNSMATVDYEEQLYMLQAVLRGAHSPLIIANMPNTTVGISIEESVRNAARAVKLGADGVHIEPTPGMVPHVKAIIDVGIPVIGHFGVQSERAVMHSGYAPAGTTAEEADEIVDLIHQCMDVGVSIALFEHTSEELVKWCRENLPIIVGSLGSGPHADFIYHISCDVAGNSAFRMPSTRQAFGNVWKDMKDAYSDYFSAAREGTFPASENSHRMKEGEFEKFQELASKRS